MLFSIKSATNKMTSYLLKKMLGGMKDVVTVNAKDMRAARTGTGSAGNEFLNTSNIVHFPLALRPFARTNNLKYYSPQHWIHLRWYFRCVTSWNICIGNLYSLVSPLYKPKILLNWMHALRYLPPPLRPCHLQVEIVITLSRSLSAPHSL